LAKEHFGPKGVRCYVRIYEYPDGQTGKKCSRMCSLTVHNKDLDDVRQVVATALAEAFGREE